MQSLALAVGFFAASVTLALGYNAIPALICVVTAATILLIREYDRRRAYWHDVRRADRASTRGHR